MSRLYFRLARRYGKTLDRLTRRHVLKEAAAAAAGLLLSRIPTLGQATPPMKPHGRRVTIIGAGFAGLACGYELKSAGYGVVVVEARDRVGGRVLSLGDVVEGRNVEGGGELIGSNHPTWAAYAERFGLQFLDVTEDENLEAPVVLDGRKLSAKESEALWEAMDEAAQTLNTDAAKVNADEPWKTPEADELDKRTMQDWLDRLKLKDMHRKAIAALLAADNGVPLHRQSYLGMLAQVAGGGGEKYWTESEVYRCRGGNQQLAHRLAQAIRGSAGSPAAGAESTAAGTGDRTAGQRVLLQCPVTEVAVRERDCVVKCADGRWIESDDVILAVPPSTWGTIRFSPALPERLRPQMGVNVKYLAAVKRRFWRDAGLAPDSLSDGPVSETWDGTDGQSPAPPAAPSAGLRGAAALPGEAAALVCFSGGRAAELCLDFAQDKRDDSYRAELETIYSGFARHFSSARFMDWPRDPWTRGGYSFPAPGQVTGIGPLLRAGLDRLHFCGEHTCYKFVGYMEGALHSGVRLARRMAALHGVVKSATG